MKIVTVSSSLLNQKAFIFIIIILSAKGFVCSFVAFKKEMQDLLLAIKSFELFSQMQLKGVAER